MGGATNAPVVDKVTPPAMRNKSNVPEVSQSEKDGAVAGGGGASGCCCRVVVGPGVKMEGAVMVERIEWALLNVEDAAWEVRLGIRFRLCHRADVVDADDEMGMAGTALLLTLVEAGRRRGAHDDEGADALAAVTGLTVARGST
jgi:hypothetical protein